MQNQTQNQTPANANENHSYQPVGGFAPALNKKGKVTITAQKNAALLNSLDKRGLQSVAVNGKGKVAKDAAVALDVDSLPGLLGSQSPLTGGQVATLRTLIISAYGVSFFNRESHKGLSGLIEFMHLVEKSLELDFAIAETATAQSKALKKLTELRAEIASVQRLLELRDMAIASSAIVTTAPKKATTAPKKATTAPKKATI